MPDYRSDLFFLQTTYLTLIGQLFRNIYETTKRPSPAKANLVQRVLPFIFYFFNVTSKPDETKGSPFRFFWHCVTFRKFLMSPEGPLSSFLLFCNRMYVNISKRVPLLHFSTLWYIFRKKMFCAFWALDIAPTLDVLVLVICNLGRSTKYKACFVMGETR